MSKKNGLMDKILAKMIPKKIITPNNLSKYDLVIVGGNLGAALSRQYNQFTKGSKNILGCYDSPYFDIYALRTLYEQKRFGKAKINLSTKQSFCDSIATTEGIAVTSILPDQNKIVLANNREIEYNCLVLGTGLNGAYSEVEGLEQAITDPNVPVYSVDEPTEAANKHFEFLSCWNYGDGYYYIPEFPISGDCENYNFLLALDMYTHYKNIGKISCLSKFTIINANDCFAPNNKTVDDFIKKELEKYDVEVIYNHKVNKINKTDMTVEYSSNDGSNVYTKSFNNFYTIKPTKKNVMLEKAGLLASGSRNQVEVDKNTLQHNKYKNIFAIGDVARLPTTKSLFGGIYQANVVRHNTLQYLEGKELNAKYNGETKSPLFLGLNKLTYVNQNYNKTDSLNNNLVMSMLNYYKYLKKIDSYKKLYEKNSSGPAHNMLGKPIKFA